MPPSEGFLARLGGYSWGSSSGGGPRAEEEDILGPPGPRPAWMLVLGIRLLGILLGLTGTSRGGLVDHHLPIDGDLIQDLIFFHAHLLIRSGHGA